MAATGVALWRLQEPNLTLSGQLETTVGKQRLPRQFAATGIRSRRQRGVDGPGRGRAARHRKTHHTKACPCGSRSQRRCNTDKQACQWHPCLRCLHFLCGGSWQQPNSRGTYSLSLVSRVCCGRIGVRSRNSCVWNDFGIVVGPRIPPSYYSDSPRQSWAITAPTRAAPMMPMEPPPRYSALLPPDLFKCRTTSTATPSSAPNAVRGDSAWRTSRRSQRKRSCFCLYRPRTAPSCRQDTAGGWPRRPLNSF